MSCIDEALRAIQHADREQTPKDEASAAALVGIAYALVDISAQLQHLASLTDEQTYAITEALGRHGLTERRP